jgi:CheY-like chemotaxis protein
MVVHAYDGLSAVELAVALDECHLVISNTKVDGMPGVELIRQLRKQLPYLPIVYLANLGRSSPDIEAQLPADVTILREPFTVGMLRSVVAKLLQAQDIPEAPRH